MADVRTSSVDKHTHDGERAVQLCNYVDVYKNDKVAPHLSLMRATASADEIARFHLEVGDSILTKDSEGPTDIGISAYVEATASDFVCGYHLAIARPLDGTHPRFLTWALRSRPILDHFSMHASGISRYGLTASGLRSSPVPWHSYEQQRRIADFLDDRVSRIDQIIAVRRQQLSKLGESALHGSWDALHGGRARTTMRQSGVPWLGEIPAHWGVLTVASQFQVDLGKMLDEKRQTGASAIPYLRNTNVQWDRVDTSDLKSMDIEPRERSRFCVEAGDLLICEGGQPGRAAIWHGGVAPLGFQKALHRARPRGATRAQWLLEYLRVAVNVGAFATGGQATILHLTNEQLRELRMPVPPTGEQDSLLAKLRVDRELHDKLAHGMRQVVERLMEYKQSLITAAVTGELDVTTAGSGIPS